MQLNTYLPPNTKSGTGTLVLTTTYGYNAADQLTSRSETGSATPFRGYAYNYSYDANGSLTAETNSVNGGEVTAYSYDARNRLVKVQKQAKATNLSTASFGYDGNNTRTSLTYGGQSTAYLQDSGGGLPVVLQETSGSQSPSSLLYSSGSTSPLYQNDPNGNGMWYHKDGLGSVRALTNSSGTVNSTNSYSAFGVSTGASGKANNDHVFAGEQLDPTGLYFNRARYYSPGIGRFIGRDSDAGSPSQPLSENPYTYAWDNPTNLTDPSGNNVAFAGPAFAFCLEPVGWVVCGVGAAVLVCLAVQCFKPILELCGGFFSGSNGGGGNSGTGGGSGPAVADPPFGDGEYSGDTGNGGGRGRGPGPSPIAPPYVGPGNGTPSPGTGTGTPRIIPAPGANPGTPGTGNPDPTPAPPLPTPYPTPSPEPSPSPAPQPASGGGGCQATSGRGCITPTPDDNCSIPNVPRIIDGTIGLEHSFDEHAGEWWGIDVHNPSTSPSKTLYLQKWRDLIVRATQSKNIVRWSTGGRATIGHLAYIPEEGKYFFVQFFIDSPAGRPAGELATAFKPSADQVRRIEDKLKNCGNKRL